MCTVETGISGIIITGATCDNYNGLCLFMLFESVQYTEMSDKFEFIALQLIVVVDPSVRLV